MSNSNTFGYPEFFEKQAYPAFERFWKVGNRVLTALNALTLNVGKPKERHHLFIRNLCMMTGMAYSDVALLAGNGCGMAAIKIARTALESAINAEYLRLNPAEDEDYFKWGAVETHRKLEYMRVHLPAAFAKVSPEEVAENDRYKAVRPRFLLPNGKMRRTWCKLNLRERAEKTGFSEMYDAFYAISSELSHASFGGLAQHAESLGDNYWEPAIQPSLEGCAIALNVAHYCAFKAVHTLVQMNEADSSPSILDLKKDYDSAWDSERQGEGAG